MGKNQRTYHIIEKKNCKYLQFNFFMILSKKKIVFVYLNERICQFVNKPAQRFLRDIPAIKKGLIPMALVTTTEMFKKAYDGGYAIGAFNVNNMEIVQGITEAAKDLNAPLILQVSKGARAYANHTYLMKLVEAAVIETGLPICLHLDHGDSFETCKSCIDGGFTSVMIDASSKPFAENIEITKKVVEYAHDRGVVVEAELGTLAGVEDEVKVSAEDSSYTRPEEVEEFVSKTGCDSLAIAIGTSHGAYKFTPAQCTRN